MTVRTFRTLTLHNIYESAAVAKKQIGGNGRASRSPAAIESVLPVTSAPEGPPDGVRRQSHGAARE